MNLDLMENLGETQLQELRDRKSDAVARLVQEFTEPLFGAALGLGFRETDAEELVQDTFVAFLEAVKRFEQRSQLKTFLFGILYNKAREAWRARRKEEATEDNQIEVIFDQKFTFGVWNCFPRAPEDEALIGELRQWIEDCSSKLPLNQRTALFMKEVEGESTESICNILGVSSTNLGVLLFRARNRMRECLEQKQLRGK